jgi:putative 4-mercaptohistidine N1-methyltranferase
VKDFYESSEALEQYLFFHYGAAKDYLPFPGSPREALDYPRRAVKELLDRDHLPKRGARALDLGCAVGATSFALSRCCASVTGVDLSRAFIRAARRMQREGAVPFRYKIEGDRRGSTTLRLPSGSKPERVAFKVGDAMKLSAALTGFDVVVMLNLIDRLPNPAACLRDIAARINPGGQLIIASPYTWMEACAPKAKWLGGRGDTATVAALGEALGPGFRMHRRRQLPFIIREHARKYQWSVAEGTLWVREST